MPYLVHTEIQSLKPSLLRWTSSLHLRYHRTRGAEDHMESPGPSGTVSQGQKRSIYSRSNDGNIVTNQVSSLAPMGKFCKICEAEIRSIERFLRTHMHPPFPRPLFA
uniref:Uncharacterized protein n=1 Tax=Coccidioides posadasii RMSCC 3488 TaxID=454284 RepID=A0A0J6FHU5_COCPO|nr:hypothetical protein CPAG_06206 [Coccidioides posadasii RMSCC 3488]